MITDKNLLLERPHPSLGGVQRIYRFSNGYGLSLVNSPMLHLYQFEWEAAVIKNVSDDGMDFKLTYETMLTDDVEVFFSCEDANDFINKAAAMFGDS